MISPETQKVLPFAAYGDQAMMVAYPTDAMKHDDKLMSMRGNNRHFTRIVAPHEVVYASVKASPIGTVAP